MKKVLFFLFFFLLVACKKNQDMNLITGIEDSAIIEIKDEDIDQFWKLYSENEEILLNSYNDGDIYQNKHILRLDEQIKKIDPSLSLEIKPNTKENRVLIITANGIPELFPAVIKIAKKAPEKKLWKIEALKQRVELPIIIDYNNMILDSRDIEVSYSKREDKRLDIEVIYPENTNDNLYITYIFLDGIIGEYDTSRYISSISIGTTKQQDKTYQTIESLRKVIDEEVKEKK